MKALALPSHLEWERRRGIERVQIANRARYEADKRKITTYFDLCSTKLFVSRLTITIIGIILEVWIISPF